VYLYTLFENRFYCRRIQHPTYPSLKLIGVSLIKLLFDPTGQWAKAFDKLAFQYMLLTFLHAFFLTFLPTFSFPHFCSGFDSSR
jgi:hypothetical protein